MYVTHLSSPHASKAARVIDALVAPQARPPLDPRIIGG
jgi:hypothetical protein